MTQELELYQEPYNCIIEQSGSDELNITIEDESGGVQLGFTVELYNSDVGFGAKIIDDQGIENTVEYEDWTDICLEIVATITSSIPMNDESDHKLAEAIMREITDSGIESGLEQDLEESE